MYESVIDHRLHLMTNWTTIIYTMHWC